MVLLKVGAPKWLAFIVVAWGACAACMAAMTNVSSYLALRLVLGIAEAGAFPGMWYYIGSFLPEDRITVPYAIINITNVLTQVFGAPIAAGILSMQGMAGLHGWQWLFIIGVLAAVLVGIPVWFCLPLNIQAAKFLTSEERTALYKANLSAAAHSHAVFNISSIWPAFKAAIGSPVVLYGSFWRVFQMMGFYGVIYWAPLIVHHIMPEGNTATIVLLVAVPFASAAIFQAFNSWHSQRTHERRWHIAAPWAAGGVLLCLLPVAMNGSAAAGLAVLTLAAVGVNSADGINVGWVSALLTGPQRAIGLAVFNSLSGLGGFVGPYVVGSLKDSTGDYSASMYALGAALVLSSIIVALFKTRWATLGPIWNLGKPKPAPADTTEGSL